MLSRKLICVFLCAIVTPVLSLLIRPPAVRPDKDIIKAACKQYKMCGCGGTLFYGIVKCNNTVRCLRVPKDCKSNIPPRLYLKAAECFSIKSVFRYMPSQNDSVQFKITLGKGNTGTSVVNSRSQHMYSLKPYISFSKYAWMSMSTGLYDWIQLDFIITLNGSRKFVNQQQYGYI